jgi:GNAT superfamily N-acetyltransferase
VDVEARPLTAEHIDAAVGVLTRGMLDNPIHVAVFGDDPGHRARALGRLFAGQMPLQSEPLEAVRDGVTVGVCGLAPPGECIGDLVRALDGNLPALSEDAGEQARIAIWLGDWGGRDPVDRRHWHLGPIAADAPLQGQGVGSVMMEAFCRRVDDAGEDAYLETDKDVNVRFYERFGFETVAEAIVLDTPNWFMIRSAGAPG